MEVRRGSQEETNVHMVNWRPALCQSVEDCVLPRMPGKAGKFSGER